MTDQGIRKQWEAAGEAWDWHAAEWATLVEYGNLPVFLDVLDHLEVGSGDDYLDVACGSGMAMADAARRGATVAGIDASHALTTIAAERSPHGDVRAGDMCELPWADDSFDCVTSFNGIWNIEAAFAEVRRVLRPGGRFGLSFWGPDENIDLFKVWRPALLELSPPGSLESRDHLDTINRPGEAERLMLAVGITPTHRSSTLAPTEFTDAGIAARAFSSTGSSWVAAKHSGEDVLLSRIEELMTPFVSPTTGLVRFYNEWVWVAGQG